ncbi:MAG TPA: terminase TerL endonuclease subunit [Pseudolabrys sp.]|jgi:phage terminase large subunit-like protein|nr:terminase TerL endonuclease subunit [Pseudolabrys sp.]
MPADDERQTLGAEVIGWIEATCRVPEGVLIGQPIELMDWQKREILRIYDNPATTRRAIISVGRKSGKTCLAACLLLVHLAGPAAIPNSQLYSTAMSRDQAALLYALAAKIVRMSPALSAAILCKDGIKQLVCPARGSAYRALSSESAVAYGLSPAFVVHDELGLVRGPRSELFEALETGSAAQLAPLSVIISTQAVSDADLLSVLLDDATAGHDPRVVCSLYTAPPDADPFDIATIKLANPALGNFQNPEEVLAMAEDARRMPARESAFRNLVLNQRVEASSPFVTPAQWRACGGEPLDLRGRDVFAGLDLSETRDLTALVLIGCDIRDGCWSAQCTFWLPSEGLHDKAKADRVPYDTWAAKGFLQTTPGASISYEYVARHLKQVFDRHRVAKIAFDRWNMEHLKPWLLNAGFTEQMIKDKFVGFGQGYKSMSPALRDLESVILEKKLRHGDHPVLKMCASNCVVERDSAGNRKLNKKRSTGRIDGMVALTMAFGVAPLKAPAFDVEAMIA